LCPAQDALLKVHAAISNAVAALGDSDKRCRDKKECQILVPTSQSANIIGKAGATIKKLRSKTRANIKITAKDASDPTHSCAMDFDNFLLVSTWDFNFLLIYC
jgi:poly(rC)-binding protein 2/3/4